MGRRAAECNKRLFCVFSECFAFSAPLSIEVLFYLNKKERATMATWNLIGTKHHVLICNGGSCMRKGGEEVTQAIRSEIERLGLDFL
jgi:hypothetical protein